MPVPETEYVTEVWCPPADDGRHALHTRMRDPEPLPEPIPEPEAEPMSTTMTTPAQASLQAATAQTAAVIADPAAGPAEVYRAAELEEAAYSQLEPGPCDRLIDPPPAESQIDWTPELEAEAEL